MKEWYSPRGADETLMSFTHSNAEHYIRRERWFVALFLICACLPMAHFVHEAWFQVTHLFGVDAPFSQNTHLLYAPDVYRIAMPAIGRALTRLLGIHESATTAALLDFILAFAALYLFYRLAVDSLSAEPGKRPVRILGLGLFLAFVQFPIDWVVPWQRPETTPSALFIAVALSCLVRARRSAWWLILLLAATVFQGFVRADVALFFSVALFGLSFCGSLLEPFGSRLTNAATGAGMVLITGSIQAYLQFVRYPHRSYTPGTAVVQGWNNLKLHSQANFIAALLPFLLIAGLMIVKRFRLDAVGALVTVASALYFVLWFTVGSLSEVRIFVPFMMALCVVAARSSTEFLMGEPASQGE
jgi:hypothetical protein